MNIIFSWKHIYFIKWYPIEIYLLIHLSNHRSMAPDVSDERPTCWIYKRRVAHPPDGAWALQATRGYTTQRISQACVATA